MKKTNFFQVLTACLLGQRIIDGAKILVLKKFSKKMKSSPGFNQHYKNTISIPFIWLFFCKDIVLFIGLNRHGIITWNPEKKKNQQNLNKIICLFLYISCFCIFNNSCTNTPWLRHCSIIIFFPKSRHKKFFLFFF